jgi:hypothetical protein
MFIHCADMKQFMDCLSALVLRGLTFESNADTLQIELTGGY